MYSIIRYRVDLRYYWNHNWPHLPKTQSLNHILKKHPTVMATSYTPLLYSGELLMKKHYVDLVVALLSMKF